MAIRTVVTRGFGNGTFSGTIPLVVLRGYATASTPAALARVAYRPQTAESPFRYRPQTSLKTSSPYRPQYPE